MEFNVALVGNPNCGKTTLFNALTGANQYVGNWPGVTVEQKKGKLKGHTDVRIVDLPGIYSLSPYTLEETVARDYLIDGDKDGKPSAIINIVDGSNLERNLYLSTQAIELGIPTVIAVNMIDIVKSNGDVINLEELSAKMGCPVVEMSALKKTGIDDVVAKVLELAQGNIEPHRQHAFAQDVEDSLRQIEEKLPADVPAHAKRFFAVKLFERDSKIASHMSSIPDVEGIVAASEKAHDDDSESIIVNERYDYINKIIDSCLTRNSAATESISDKIDKVVTNRFLALPIFVVIMFLVYYFSITTVGTWATDCVNDGIFGEGWYLDPMAIVTQEGTAQANYDEAAAPYEEAAANIEAFNAAAEEAGLEVPEALPEDATEAEQAEYDAAMAAFIEDAEAANVVASYDSYDDESGEDEVVEVDAATYAESLEVPEVAHEDFGLWIPGIPTLVGDAMEAADVDEVVQALVLDGIIAGVGAPLGFLPQMLVLFFFLALLEGCGYMSRIAFILDRIFRRFGLSGKSFIPMLIGTGCGVPGVMASRTIENENDRRMTVTTTTFMPCSAKLPIIALFAGAVFGGVWWVAPSAYFLGIGSILVSGVILKKTKPFSGQAAPFVMELPAYHIPTFGSVVRSMGERCWSFLKKAATIILFATILVWFLSSFGMTESGLEMVDDQSVSLLAALGNAVAWIFSPLGWGNWQAAAATVTGLIAKENVVGTFGVLYNGAPIPDLGWYANVQLSYTTAMAYSFLAFNLLCAPCFAAMGAIRKEMNGGKWFWAAIGYECGFAYLVALVVFQLGGLATGEATFGVWTLVAIAVVAAGLYLLFRPNKYKDKKGMTSVAAAEGAAA
ncbi:ferrous iron transporter B [Curtanaerobium respiraculi]|uniref:ferrous iron transporter B n=1 Tax=Curtanaerobium respiraculi TaxID=2949669 RepID=UPI0024B33181|nr:ferrous iron transporter B [Curtanaerobium respiraculi]